jgi:hypothetical protein
MRGFAVVAMALGVGCYSPQPKSGSPCFVDLDCPSAFVCSPSTLTCESNATLVDAPRPIDAQLIDGCTPSREVCGNGEDEDCDGVDPACQPNDVASAPVDVTAGGMFTGDALLARDDVGANGCGGNGGRDLFFEVTLAAPQIYYVETFGSNYDTVIRVYAKSCATVGTGAGAATCVDDACNGDRGHVAWNLPAGKSCIVIDQKEADELDGNLLLRVTKGGRAGIPLLSGVRVNTGDTCGATNTIDALDQNCDSPGDEGRDHTYFFTTCPGQTLKLDADICPEPDWDPTLHVRRHNDNAQIGCNDDTCGFGPTIANVNITGGVLYFLFVDGFDAEECGPYSLDTNLRP